MGITDVIILGAGASKSEGAPLQKELFKSFFDYLHANHSWDGSEFAKETRTIRKYFRDFWGINIKKGMTIDEEFPTFEECLGILDIGSSRNQSFRNYHKQEIRVSRNALIFLIAKILDEKLRSKGVHHRKLVKRLREKGTLKQTAFISLNYDILIDNALVDLYEEYHLDYSVDFLNFERRFDFERPDPQKAVLLLKLHGSLNWLFCPTCIGLERKPRKATEAFYKPEPCQNCQTPMEPVIIPPSFLKEMSNPFIQEILIRADSVLRNAKRVFICGYSFPDADLHVKYLLKRAELYNQGTPQIVVVDKNDTEEFKNRFRRFFKDENKVQFTEGSFERFCQGD